MKKILSVILAIALVLGFGVSAFAEADIPLKLYSDAAMVIDMSTGEVLYALNPDETRYPASTTKMLTGILALENLDLNDTVTVDKEAAGIGGNTLNLKAGEKFTVKDLIYGTMVISANDGAVALAKKVSGNVEEFAKLMNEKAVEIGCTSSNFVNPNGLHDDKHYTTARDLSLIAMYCMKNEIFREIVSLPSYTVPKTNLSDERYVENTNWLLNDEVDSHRVYAGNEYRYCKYDGCIGIKTGQTNAAGCCLVAAAKRNDTTVLIVCLHSKNTFERFADAILLLDLGFASFKTEKKMTAETELGTVKVKKGSVRNATAVLEEDVLATLKKGEAGDIITTEVKLDEKVKAPVVKGQNLGVVNVYKSGELIGTYNAVAKEDVPEGGFLSNFGITDATAHIIGKIVKVILWLLLLCIVALTIYVIYEKRRIAKKKARKAARLKAKMERENLNKSDFNRKDF